MKTSQVSASKPLPRQRTLSPMARFRALDRKYQRAVREWNSRWSAQYESAERIDREMDELNAVLAEAAKQLQPAIDKREELEAMKTQLSIAAVRVLEERIAARAKAVRVPRRAA